MPKPSPQEIESKIFELLESGKAKNCPAPPWLERDIRFFFSVSFYMASEENRIPN